MLTGNIVNLGPTVHGTVTGPTMFAEHNLNEHKCKKKKNLTSVSFSFDSARDLLMDSLLIREDSIPCKKSLRI